MCCKKPAAENSGEKGSQQKGSPSSGCEAQALGEAVQSRESVVLQLREVPPGASFSVSGAIDRLSGQPSTRCMYTRWTSVVLL